MKNKVTFIVGLPGSGKTHLLNKLVNENTFTIGFDDPDEHSLELALEMLKNNLNIVFADCNLCIKENRDNATKIILNAFPETKIEWIFFENSPKKCFNNVALRGEKGDIRNVSADIHNLSTLYLYDDINVLEIYQAPKKISSWKISELLFLFLLFT